MASRPNGARHLASARARPVRMPSVATAVQELPAERGESLLVRCRLRRCSGQPPPPHWSLGPNGFTYSGSGAACHPARPEEVLRMMAVVSLVRAPSEAAGMINQTEFTNFLATLGSVRSFPHLSRNSFSSRTLMSRKRSRRPLRARTQFLAPTAGFPSITVS